VSLQVAHGALVPPAAALPVEIADRPTRAWFDAWHCIHGGEARAELALLERVSLPSAYARVMLGSDVVAVGRAVADTGWAGVFGMATLPSARGRGAARSVLAALAAWAGGRSVEHLYLQVERGNAAALRLYAEAGFTELSAYHYRAALPRRSWA
jgi:GNAT superfamily N-acetyltransferase